VTPNGRKVYITLNASDSVLVSDFLTGPVAIITLGTCTGPNGIAIGLAGGVFPTAYVACSNGEVAVIDAAVDAFLGSGAIGSGGAFYGVAITPDDALVYVTDSSNNEVVVFDAISGVEISGSPFAAGVTAPHGVIISADGNRVYLAGSGSDDVIALATADNTTVVAGPISTGLGSGPEALAVTPDALGAHVYVTLTGTDEFVVIDDTLATPAVAPTRSIDPGAGVGAVRVANVVAITTTAAHGFAVGQKVIVDGVNDASFDGAFVIAVVPTPTSIAYVQVAADATSESGTVGPIEALTPASSPFGVTIPPLLAAPFRAYIAQFSLNNVAIHDDETVTPFGVNGASPIALTALSNPMGIAHIRVPR
jgi:DNA-binding beta-propeller fold protein YncE